MSYLNYNTNNGGNSSSYNYNQSRVYNYQEMNQYYQYQPQYQQQQQYAQQNDSLYQQEQSQVNYYNYAHSNDSNDTYDDSDTNEYWKNVNSYNSNVNLPQKYNKNYYNNNNFNYQITNQPFQQLQLQQQPKNNYYHQDSNNIAHISSETFHYTSFNTLSTENQNNTYSNIREFQASSCQSFNLQTKLSPQISQNIQKHKETSLSIEKCDVCSIGSEEKTIMFACNGTVCEACKKFFERTIKTQKEKGLVTYKCSKLGNCPINQYQRSCQFCRFQKCIYIGMTAGKSKQFSFKI
jgi:hypothetical protein